MDHQQHDGHFNQNPYDGGQGGPRLETEKTNGCGHSELKKVGRANQARRAGHAMRHIQFAIKQVGEPLIEKNLNQNRHSQQSNNQWLLDNGLALKREQQRQREQ